MATVARITRYVPGGRFQSYLIIIVFRVENSYRASKPFSRPCPGLLHAAKWKLDATASSVGVDIDLTSLDPPCDPQGTGAVLRPNTCHQTKISAVGQPHGIRFVFGRQNGEHRTKKLPASQAHSRGAPARRCAARQSSRRLEHRWWRRRHAPAHRGHFALCAGVMDDRGGCRETRLHWCKVADIAVDAERSS